MSLAPFITAASPTVELGVAFVLTLVIEVPIVVGIAVMWKPSTPASSAASAAFLANVISHPLGIGLVWPILGSVIGAANALAVVEALVVILEFGVYTYRLRDPVLAATLSGVANLASFSLGALLFAVIPST